jgi:hypothetical protein
MRIVIVACLLLIASCVTLTPGAKVRRIESNEANACKIISTEKAESVVGYSPSNCQNKAFASMINEVASLGGNAYVITQQSPAYPCLFGGTTLTFEVYSCPVH